MCAKMLDELKKHTIIVADTGDIDAIKTHKPRDATTNPSLLYKAAQMPQYKSLVDEAVHFAKSHAKSQDEILDKIIVKLFVNFGSEIIKILTDPKGRVSTEVDARLSFDTKASIARAHEYIALYEEKGIGKERVLIKLASTWEGIEAARVLEKEGIHCNMTLMFGLGQAIAAAEAGATLISPFVGRIYDWQKVKEKKDVIQPSDDMGVKSVRRIFNYYKKFGYKTQIMGASFRNIGQILALCGCDLLTISPDLLDQLGAEGSAPLMLDASKAKLSEDQKMHIDEKGFRWALNDDEMANDKLSEGIRNFAKDTVKLEAYIRDHFLKGGSTPPKERVM